MAEGAPVVTERTIELMNQSGLWVRIVSVFMIIGLLLMVLLGIAGIVMGVAVVRRHDGPPFVLAGAGYLVMSLFYPAPIFFLFRFASQAKALATVRGEEHLEGAMKAQKSFWKYTAILMMVMTILTIFLGIAGLIFALMNSR